MKSIIYDENLDILELDNGLKTSHCIEIGDLFIVHCDSRNKVIGLEILGISQIYQIDKNTLKSIRSAEILINTSPQEEKTFIITKFISVIENKQPTESMLTAPPIKTHLAYH